ncbi:MAG: amidohydrolase [Bacteroidales bacterium]|nr:amidohydrolase [Bacteroidales bacterium]
MQDLTLTLVQSNLVWEDRKENLKHFEVLMEQIAQQTDVILLPEAFNTGFSMNPERLAEPIWGPTMEWMKNQAEKHQAIVAGSLFIHENGHFFNRFVWMSPKGEFQYYDKAHLFRYGGEHETFSNGKQKTFISFKGWRISPLICYDLRFPVWSMNQWDKDSGFDFDLLLYVANWPSRRIHAWKSLLVARAIENQCFVAGVNRCGIDGNNINHNGSSLIVDPNGNIISDIPLDLDYVETITLKKALLDEWRSQFQAWQDWDRFQII